ncbi:MAG: hypothetical protein J5I93_28210, partial [Pirellulaceae bacterium]|nr:hypothetical protein [Pirellulaceae bacterium]
MPTMMRISLLAVLVALALGVRSSLAGDCVCDVQCPQCQHVCKFEFDKDTVDKHCWKVKIEPVCVPPIKWPWEPCCSPPRKCAKVRYVKKLVKHEYECEVCKCKWTPVCAGCQGTGAGAKAPVKAVPPTEPPQAATRTAPAATQT